ncbi:uncharacterized protein NEMAJ01_2051 [Nematocida major]|uniref:uncharacterized protein n=1 Tax=Nematocida major TaxID=1912982 RepID=UPI002008B4B7|nr:uncharacterized protein NEMAJ01_2051 [Nematocida major]KAH9387155.1 hypothetical protein NEMAJ01_2051 [Nematocida major]
MGSGIDENRVGALEECRKYTQMAEIDVQLSMDLDVFVRHDLNVGDVLVEDMQTEHLQNALGLPLLSEVLAGTGIDLNVEVKYEAQKISREVWCECVVSTVEKGRRGRYVVYSSFDRGVCEILKRRGLETLFLVEELVEESVVYAEKMQYMGIVTDASSIWMQTDLIENMQEKNMCLLTYGKDNTDPGKAKKQISMGVHGIITDAVPEIARCLEQMP